MTMLPTTTTTALAMPHLQGCVEFGLAAPPLRSTMEERMDVVEESYDVGTYCNVDCTAL